MNDKTTRRKVLDFISVIWEKINQEIRNANEKTVKSKRNLKTVFLFLHQMGILFKALEGG